MPMDQLRRMTAEIMGADELDVTARTGLFGQLDIVSVAKLIIKCERRYRITIDDERVPYMLSLGDLNSYINDKLEAGENRRTPTAERERDNWFYE